MELGIDLDSIFDQVEEEMREDDVQELEQMGDDKAEEATYAGKQASRADIIRKGLADMRLPLNTVNQASDFDWLVLVLEISSAFWRPVWHTVV